MCVILLMLLCIGWNCFSEEAKLKYIVSVWRVRKIVYTRAFAAVFIYLYVCCEKLKHCLHCAPPPRPYAHHVLTTNFSVLCRGGGGREYTISIAQTEQPHRHYLVQQLVGCCVTSYIWPGICFSFCCNFVPQYILYFMCVHIKCLSESSVTPYAGGQKTTQNTNCEGHTHPPPYLLGI